MAVAKVWLRLLGRPTVEVAGEGLALRRRQPVALLAYLALAAGPVARARLLLLLFPDCDETLARQRLSRLLHELRRALREAGHAQLLLASGETLALDLSYCQVDALRFAVAADATALPLAEALALYRGPLLDGFGLADAPEFELWLTSEREQLERLFHQLLARHAQAALDGEAWAEAEARSRQLLAADPLREDAHVLLMEALAGQGQRGAMLRQYDVLCELLRRELDAAPLPKTQARYRALLDKANVPVLPEERAPLLLAPPLVGRSAELARIRDALAQGNAGTPQLVCILGASGVGKTRLLDEALSDTRLGVLRLSCHAAPPSSSYQALVEALRDAGAPELEALWRHAGLSAGAEQQLWERLIGLLRSVVGAAPLVLAIDDVQWADASLLRALPYLTRRLAAQPLLLCVTYNSDERSALANECLAALARLIREPHWIELAPLPRDAADTLVASWLGAAPAPELGQRIYTETEGNPFFLTELLRGLRERGDHGFDVLPHSMRGAVEERFARLPQAARSLAEIAAVAGRECAPNLLRRVASLDEEALLAGLERLERAGLLADLGGRYRFTHSKIRETIYLGLSQTRRRQLHGRFASALGYLRQPGAAAARLDHARRAHDWELAVDAARAAAAEARRLVAFDDALNFERAALEALDKSGATPEQRVEVLLAREDDAHRLGRRDEQAADLATLAALGPLAGRDDERLFREGRYLEAVGRWPEARGLLEQVVALASEPAARHAARLLLARRFAAEGEVERALNLANAVYSEAESPELRLRACLALADLAQLREDYGEAGRWLDVAQPLVRYDPAQRPRLADLIARNELRRGNFERMLRYAARAREGYAASGDLAGQANCLTLEGIAQSRLWHFRAAIAALERAHAIHIASANPRGQAVATLNMAIQRYRLGDFELAHRGFCEAWKGFDAEGDRQGQNIATLNLAVVDIARGALDEAERWSQVALEQAQTLGQPLREAQAWACLAAMLQRRGDAAAAYAARAHALMLRPKDVSGDGAELALQALVCLELGRPAEADELSRAAVAGLAATPNCEQPQQIHAIRALVAQRAGNLETAHVALQQARQALDQILAGLPSPADRRRLLDAFPANRFIRAASRGDWTSERPV